MKPSQFAKGFQARPDTTSSEKRTALDRLNAIDGLVKNGAPTGDVPNRVIQPVLSQDVTELEAADIANESAAYRAWRIEHAYRPGQVRIIVFVFPHPGARQHLMAPHRLVGHGGDWPPLLPHRADPRVHHDPPFPPEIVQVEIEKNEVGTRSHRFLNGPLTRHGRHDRIVLAECRFQQAHAQDVVVDD